jgi:hypothetical protein
MANTRPSGRRSYRAAYYLAVNRPSPEGAWDHDLPDNLEGSSTTQNYHAGSTVPPVAGMEVYNEEAWPLQGQIGRENMDPKLRDVVASIVAAVGSVVLYMGYTDAATWAQVSGGVMTLLAIALPYIWKPAA